ncbi:MAG: DUF5076 domain-containing protein [Planctomycetales bacterium]
MPHTHPNQLPVPPAAASDPKGVELVRVWGAGGKQHVTIAAEIWEDPECWGMMLVDLAQHLANAYEESVRMPREDALQRIKAGFDAEWDYPTDEPMGHFHSSEQQDAEAGPQT